MRIGIITVDRAEQRTHNQEKRIHQYDSSLLIAPIDPYNDDAFINKIPEAVFLTCMEQGAHSAIMKSVLCITPDPEEFINNSLELHGYGVNITFLDEPWLSTDIWFKKKQSAAVNDIYKQIVNLTYEQLNKKAKRYAAARKAGTATAKARGTHPGPKKGTYTKNLPLKEERMRQVLEASPTFNKTKDREVDVCRKLGIPPASYFRYLKELKMKYPERIIKQI